MTTKLKLTRFRTRRPEFPSAEAPAPVPPVASAALTPAGAPPPPPQTTGAQLFDNHDDGFGALSLQPTAPLRAKKGEVVGANGDSAGEGIEKIKREGLTGRQLRMARRLAQKHNLPATSDFDAVRLLRNAGIDPFERTSLLELVTSDGALSGAGPAKGEQAAPDGIKLPQTFKPAQVPSTEMVSPNPLAELSRIQQDIARRRRRNSFLLLVRLICFVFLPTLVTGWYYYEVATPIYATKSEFVIQQSQAPTASAGGLGGLLKGSPLATSQDSIAVQGYLQSREAMLRLDEDHGFKDHFSDPSIDPIQRLAPDATLEQAYKVYTRNVQISYDPTEGLVKMQILAADPTKAVEFAQALIGYAEGQVDQLTQRMREDQMKGAREAYAETEADMLEAQRRVVALQEQFKVLSSEVEVSLITAQIGQLESLLTQDRLSMQQLQANANPNAARVEPLQRRIKALEFEIEALRSKLTENDGSGMSLAQVQSELLVAQADVTTRQLMLAQSLQAMEATRAEANRQTRYLSLSVKPITPDEAAYPRAFENTVVAMLIFAGVYLMISITAAVLREQLSS
ncbi:MAG: capsule biosynthesis protein [Pseudorhodobacter sp.]|nr:capsule biosynthesis protein [Pseudorhodobacter sp.]